MSTMAAAVAVGPGQVECREVPAPEPADDRVLVKTLAASVCGSDTHVLYMGWNVSGYPLPPGFPGHEGVGVVLDGGRAGLSRGDRVLTAPSIFTARVFAEYQSIESKYLLKLPDGPPLEHLLMAQQLGTVVYGCKRLPPVAGKTAAIIGQGSVGLFHAFMLKRMGAARVIAVEPIAARREAGLRMGADDAIDATGRAATDAVLDLTGGQGADLVIEAVGSAPTLNQALNVVRDEGHVCAFGLPESGEPVPFEWDTFFRRRVTMNAVFGAQDVPGLPDFQAAVDMIASGEIDVAPLTTHRFPLERVQEAMDLAHSPAGDALKVGLTFG